MNILVVVNNTAIYISEITENVNMIVDATESRNFHTRSLFNSPTQSDPTVIPT
jgi:hypothetical protein